ncbi:MAG: hypothetical protein J2P49_02090 [Methylocapsa sp.]|nr:hypothetical protein [Methylocapsa sp.]
MMARQAKMGFRQQPEAEAKAGLAAWATLLRRALFWSTDDFAVVVVGAGAAGLGAAMRLAAWRVSLIRGGGRAHTITEGAFPLDLDLEFNSLDAQREAYIKSQAHEGWRLDAGV